MIRGPEMGHTTLKWDSLPFGSFATHVAGSITMMSLNN